MDDENLDHRAKTLSALDAFIASQRALLARTHDDIERLRGLKGEVLRDPEAFFDNVDERLDSPSFRLGDAGDAYNLTFKHTIEWGAFTGCDPTPLLSLPPRSPLRTQSTPPSKLQLLVKSARTSIIDPILTKFPPPAPLSDAELEGIGKLPLDPEEQKRQREHTKIRELQRIVRAGGKGYSYGNGNARGGGLRVPKQAVFVREDVEDESIIQVDVDVDVDVGMDINGGESATPTPATATVPSAMVAGGNKEETMDMDVGEGVPSPPLPPPHSESRARARAKVPPPPAPRTSSRRSTRTAAAPPPSTAAASTSTSTSTSSRPSKRVKVKHEFHEEEEGGEDGEYDPYGGASTKGKAPSSTPPSPYNGYGYGYGYGGKTVDAMGRSGSTPSVGGKSLESLGLGGKTPPTSTSMGKHKRSARGVTTKEATANEGGSRGMELESRAKKEKGVRGKPGKEGKTEKTRPETYKQAWSVEEQRLLEQLLEEIPEGEGFRWQKISRAMGGRRTPRQVASRVQKYFEKLKRFGVG